MSIISIFNHVLDPEQSKIIESHAGLWGLLILLITIFLLITGLIGKLWTLIKLVFSKIIRILKKSTQRGYYILPKETMKIIPQPRESYWSRGTVKKGGIEIDVVLLGAKFYVTNLTKGAIHIISTYTKKPRSESTFPMIKEPMPRAHYWGHNYPILARSITEVQSTYVTDYFYGKEGKDIKGIVVFVDQLGNDHKVNTIFKQSPEMPYQLSYFRKIFNWFRAIPTP